MYVGKSQITSDFLDIVWDSINLYSTLLLLSFTSYGCNFVTFLTFNSFLLLFYSRNLFSSVVPLSNICFLENIYYLFRFSQIFDYLFQYHPTVITDFFIAVISAWKLAREMFSVSNYIEKKGKWEKRKYK